MGCGNYGTDEIVQDVLSGGMTAPSNGYKLFGDDSGGPQDQNPLLTEALQTISNYKKIAPHQLAAINEFGPQFAKAYGNTLAATYEGTLNAYENQISPALARVQSAQRASDIGDVAQYGAASRQAILDSNPDVARLLETLNSQAMTDLEAGTSLTPEEQRQMQQAARASMAARGMNGTNAAVADEVLRQYNLGTQRQQQRRGFATGVVGLNQAVVGDPFMQILGRSGQAVNAANNLAAQGQGQVSQAGAGNLYDPFRDAYSTMFHNQDIAAAEKAAKMQMTGQIIGGALGAAGSVGAGFCWAAREVFGAEEVGGQRSEVGGQNLKWLAFREWMLFEAPTRFRNWYVKNGQRWAARLKQNPAAKAVVKRWMERRIQKSEVGSRPSDLWPLTSDISLGGAA